MSAPGGRAGREQSPADPPRGALAQFGRDALSDLGDELRYALIVIGFVGVGAGVGYAAGRGEGAVVGGLVGAGVLAVIGAVVLVRWVWGSAHEARRRLRSR